MYWQTSHLFVYLFIFIGKAFRLGYREKNVVLLCIQQNDKIRQMFLNTLFVLSVSGTENIYWQKHVILLNFCWKLKYY